MKNQKERELLNFLSKECELNKFSVIDKRDILSSFDKKLLIDEDELDSLMLSLERQAKVKIKYEDESVYCLCLLGKEIELDEKKEEKTPLLSRYFIVSFFASMLGSLLGSLVIMLIIR